MSLNIKSIEADQLVEALSNITGESKTQAVIEALRERLERARRERDREALAADLISIGRRRDREALAADLISIGRRCAASGRHDTTDHGGFLYDERGLPR